METAPVPGTEIAQSRGLEAEGTEIAASKRQKPWTHVVMKHEVNQEFRSS